MALRRSFFHNGAVRTLDEAVRFYVQRDADPALSEAEIADVVAFLKTLTDADQRQCHSHTCCATHAASSSGRSWHAPGPQCGAHQEQNMTQLDHAAVKSELDRLTAEFFRAVSFEEDGTPPYDNIHGLFIEGGLIIKNTASPPEISTARQFVEARLAMFRSGEMTRFNEAELFETTEVFGKVAHRFSSYAKSGTSRGVPFTARGMISTQFILTPAGWKISAMTWDDERPGLSIPERYEPPAIRSH